MEFIAKYAKVIIGIAFFMMLVKLFFPIEQLYNVALNILFVLVTLPVLIIEYKVKAQKNKRDQ